MEDEMIFSLFESLKREMEGMRQELKQELKQDLKQELRPIRDSLERIETRLSRQGEMLKGGTRQVARLITWSEEVDEMMAERDSRFEDLARRVEILEKKNGEPS